MSRKLESMPSQSKREPWLMNGEEAGELLPATPLPT